jgi:hypothetical protein
MNDMNMELVNKLAERYRLRITIRPDGGIIGPKSELDRLRGLYEMYDGYYAFKRAEERENPPFPDYRPGKEEPRLVDGMPIDEQAEEEAKAAIERWEPNDLSEPAVPVDGGR